MSIACLITFILSTRLLIVISQGISAAEIAKLIIQYRRGRLDVSAWPDCTPAANDKRLAREFLLFLDNFGLCRRVEGNTNLEDRYFVDEALDSDVISNLTTASIFMGDVQAEEVLDAVRHSSMPSIIERQRTTTTVLSRTGQPKFRKQILKVSPRLSAQGTEMPFDLKRMAYAGFKGLVEAKA